MRTCSRLGSSLEKFNRKLLKVIYFAVGLKAKEEVQKKRKRKTENWSYGVVLKGKVWKIINGGKKKAFPLKTSAKEHGNVFKDWVGEMFKCWR
ncbi:hypothetical protein CEXT_657161 [Caerostris extrusa]|uniref:Uncharacterized protein n=1 Tax=Caerostris extrusa TaxID=172846 RepID=A0AAV4WPY8_CAEEX|nr:hypothetical protein CEXT_657161 [Caerostris extrusa]